MTYRLTLTLRKPREAVSHPGSRLELRRRPQQDRWDVVIGVSSEESATIESTERNRFPPGLSIQTQSFSQHAAKKIKSLKLAAHGRASCKHAAEAVSDL